MATPVIMPKFEMAQEAGTVVRWLKEAGQMVEKGEPILEVETDKVVMEIEAPASGILEGIQAQPGQEVPIGLPIAHILQPGEAWTSNETARGALQPRNTQAATSGAPVQATPLAERVARAEAVDLGSVAGSGPGGRVTRADVEAHLSERAGGALRTEAVTKEEKVQAAPAARRLARQLGVDLQAVAGSGPGGRVQSTDVLQASPHADADLQAAAGYPEVRRVVPLSRMRRTIAERMLISAREAPQFSVSADADMRRALQVVEDWRVIEEKTGGPHVSLTAFLVKACAWALARHPALNAAVIDGQILEWAEINIGVAVAVQAGLVVPVIHRSDLLGLEEIAAQLEGHVSRAREGRLRPEDVLGGTFTLSNLGTLRVDRFTPLLNPPQAGILAVGQVSRRVWASEEEQLEIRPVATFTLTADHRVVDGAVAGSFLESLLTAIEQPGLLIN